MDQSLHLRTPLQLLLQGQSLDVPSVYCLVLQFLSVILRGVSETKHSRPDQDLEAQVEAEANFMRPRPIVKITNLNYPP